MRAPSRLLRVMEHPVSKSLFGLITALNLALGSAVAWHELTADQQQVIQVVVPPTNQPPALCSDSNP